MRRASITLTLLCVGMGAQAGELEDVVACIKAAERFAGVTLDVSDAKYQFRFLSRCTATWPNAVCEVDLGKVYNLKINDQDVIVEQFVGRDAFDLNRQLDLETKAAIENLRTRIRVLETRQTEVTGCLRNANPNFAGLTSFVRDGIKQASIGGKFNSLDSCQEDSAPVPGKQEGNAEKSTARASDSRRVDGADEDQDVSATGLPEESTSSVPAPSRPQSATTPAWVSANALNGRTCPSTACGIVGVYRLHDHITVYETQAGWSRVSEYSDAKCANGISPMVTSGERKCVPNNGIRDGRYAQWVSSQHLSPAKPQAPASPTRRPEPRRDDRVFGAQLVDECKRIVQGKLKDRRSAEFRNVIFVRGREGVAVVCGEVNARNSFGGYAGFERFICNGSSELTVLQSQVSDFHNLWNRVCVK